LLHLILTSALDASEWLALHPGRLLLGKEPLFLLDILDVLQLKDFENLCMP